MSTRNPQATVLLYAYPHTLLPGNTTLCAVDELKGLAQDKIIKKSVILFRVLNMTI